MVTVPALLALIAIVASAALITNVPLAAVPANTITMANVLIMLPDSRVLVTLVMSATATTCVN